MRTKTLLLTAAICAAGVLSSMAAGVTSVNVVGYINVQVPAGFSFIANQLQGASVKVSDLLPTAPVVGDKVTVLYSWDGGFTPNAFDGEAWESPDATLAPGGGALIFAPAAFTVTFVGEVKQGTLNTAVPQGFSFVSSQVPQAGGISALGYSAGAEDVVYTWDGGFSPTSYDGEAWDPSEPQLAVGQSVLLFRKGAATSWSRTFTVN